MLADARAPALLAAVSHPAVLADARAPAILALVSPPPHGLVHHREWAPAVPPLRRRRARRESGHAVVLRLQPLRLADVVKEHEDGERAGNRRERERRAIVVPRHRHARHRAHRPEDSAQSGQALVQPVRRASLLLRAQVGDEGIRRRRADALPEPVQELRAHDPLRRNRGGEDEFHRRRHPCRRSGACHYFGARLSDTKI